MSAHAGQPTHGVPVPVPPRDSSDYRGLLARLASRARRFGSVDAEGAAQETLKRALENPRARLAVEFYFGEHPSSAIPEWPLDRVLAWLHAVLRNVVREEHGRMSSRNERSRPREGQPDPTDPTPDPLG